MLAQCFTECRDILDSAGTEGFLNFCILIRNIQRRIKIFIFEQVDVYYFVLFLRKKLYFIVLLY